MAVGINTTPEPKYSVRIFTEGALFSPALYLKPEAISARSFISTIEIEKAASFATAAQAEKFWHDVKGRLKNTTATVVRVDHGTESTFTPTTAVAFGAVSPELSYVLTRPDTSGYCFRTVKDTYTPKLQDAQRFPSLSQAVRALMAAQRGSPHYVLDVTTITAVRETTRSTFKITEVSKISDYAFVEFPIQGSSVIKSLAYDSTRKILRITLTRGAKQFGVNGERMQPNAVYQYADVSAEDVFAFLAADSKGSYWSKTFKGKYDRSASKV